METVTEPNDGRSWLGVLRLRRDEEGVVSVQTVTVLFAIWCVASVPIGVFLGKWIAGPR